MSGTIGAILFNVGGFVRKTGSGVRNLVSLKVFLGPGASFAPY